MSRHEYSLNLLNWRIHKILWTCDSKSKSFPLRESVSESIRSPTYSLRTINRASDTTWLLFFLTQRFCTDITVQVVAPRFHPQSHRVLILYHYFQILVRLFQSSRRSIIGMLKVKWPMLPDECSQLVQFYEEEEQLALSSTPPFSFTSLLILKFSAIFFLFLYQ